MNNSIINVTIEKLLNQIINVIYIIYIPSKIVYEYYIINTYFFLDSKKKYNQIKLIFYVLYHIILQLNILYLMQSISNKETSTLDRFHKTKKGLRKYNGKDINLFLFHKIENKAKRLIRKCKKCKTYKPPRTNHCDKCNLCYFKMDSHSNLLNVCINFYNYKYFILFIISSIIRNIFSISVLFIGLFIFQYTTSSLIFIIFIFFDTIGLIFQFTFHLPNLLNNETTIERIGIDHLIKGEARYRDIFQEGIDYSKNYFPKERNKINPYNINKWENIKQVFGNNIKGILPIFTSLGNGIDFETNY